MEFHTADLCDKYEEQVRAGRVRVLDPIFTAYGGRPAFDGPIATLKLFEDNSLVRQALEAPGAGRILVIDGGGSRRCALVGDQLAELAGKNGWSGIIVYGCIRDSQAIGAMDIGVLALGTYPLKSLKRGIGEADAPVSFAGITFHPGEWLYADADGAVLSPDPL